MAGRDLTTSGPPDPTSFLALALAPSRILRRGFFLGLMHAFPPPSSSPFAHSVEEALALYRPSPKAR